MTEVASMRWLTEEPNDEKTKAIHDVMKNWFGYDSFRPGQYRAVRATADHHDSMVLIATGGGKSLCYMLPAARKNTFTLVLTPLKALMEDQVHHLVDKGIPAEYINQKVDVYKQREIYRKALAGRLRILYVAPERLGNGDFLRFIHGMRKIDLLVVDEAHCVLDWGDGGFRPDYLRIRGFIESLRTRPVVMALTATASPAQEDEMKELLGLDDPLVIRTSADRPNIVLHRVKIPNKEERMSFMLDWIREHPGKGVIYRENKDDGKDISSYLADHGVNVALYNAKLDDSVKSRTLEAFRTGELSVVVATTAFGMGVDIPDIRWVVNVGPCKNLEQFWQQTGRAGRDGLPADSVVIWWDGEFGQLRHFIKDEREKAKNGGEFEKAKRKGERLSMMSEYCESNDCLRARMLRLFGEHPAPHCDSCDVCRPDLDQGAIDDHADGNGKRKTRKGTRHRARPDALDNTKATQQAMHKALAYIGRHIDGGGTAIGVTTYAAGLTKSESDKTKRNRLDRIPGYGDLEGVTQARVGDIIRALIGIQALQQVGKYNVLHKGPRFDQCINGGMPGPDEMPQFAIPRDAKTTDEDHGGNMAIPQDVSVPETKDGDMQELKEPTEEEYAKACGLIRERMTETGGRSLGVRKFAYGLKGPATGKIVEELKKERLDTYPQYGSVHGTYEQAKHIYDRLREQGAIKKGPYNTLIPGPRFEEFLHPQHRQEGDE